VEQKQTKPNQSEDSEDATGMCGKGRVRRQQRGQQERTIKVYEERQHGHPDVSPPTKDLSFSLSN
jgi:hypothetical protein